MKKFIQFLQQKFKKKSTKNFDDVREQFPKRNWNIAARMDLGHNRKEKKK